MTSNFSVELSRKRRPSSTTTRANGELSSFAASGWKYPKSSGTLGTKSTTVVGIPHDIDDRKLVPIPKQITSAFFGGRDMEASGRCAMYLVIGVIQVIPTPFTRSI